MRASGAVVRFVERPAHPCTPPKSAFLGVHPKSAATSTMTARSRSPHPVRKRSEPPISTGSTRQARMSAGHHGAVMDLGTTSMTRAPSSRQRLIAGPTRPSGGMTKASSLCNFPQAPQCSRFQSCLPNALTPSQPSSSNLDHHRSHWWCAPVAKRSTVISPQCSESAWLAIMRRRTGVQCGPGSAAMLSRKAWPGKAPAALGPATVMNLGTRSLATNIRLSSIASCWSAGEVVEPFSRAVMVVPSKPLSTAT